MYGFDKTQRSSFSYWFAHWCAFQMVALNLHIWKPKYLLHDIEKPWMRLFLPYKKVQRWHRFHNSHHLEYLFSEDGNLREGRGEKFDIDSCIIDWECSRFTKEASPRTCRQEIERYKKEGEYCRSFFIQSVIFPKMLKRLDELGI